MNEGRLAELEAFLAVADAASFKAAARGLGLTQSTVSRRLVSLERRLGVELVSRTTRSVALTPAGLAFADEVRDLVARLRDAEARASRGEETIAGLVRMTMPSAYGRVVVMPILAALLVRHLGLRFDADLSDRYADLQAGLDVAIRFSDEAPSGWTCVPLGDYVGRLCAAPSYLAAANTIATIDDLADQRLLVARTYTPRTTWSFVGAEGRRSLEVSPAAVVSDFVALAELTASGAGVAALPSFLADGEIYAGRLIEVLPGLLDVSAKAFACVRRDLTSVPRIRVTLNALAQRGPTSRPHPEA